MKRNLDHRNCRQFRERRLQTNEFSEHSQNSWKIRRKVTVWGSKLKETYRTAKTKKIRWTCGREAMPAGCGWTWSHAHHLSHQPS